MSPHRTDATFTDADGREVTMPLQRLGVRDILDRVFPAPRVGHPFSGANRQARRAAEAEARKRHATPQASLSQPRCPTPAETVFVTTAATLEECEANRARYVERLARSRELSMEWMRVQALEGRIIDTATPEERAAREIALHEEFRRIEALEADCQ